MRHQNPEGLCCPTCGARQGWAETCRRCKCDLRLLRAAVGAYVRNRRDCVLYLYTGFSEAALRCALKCHQLQPGAESRRLTALAYAVAEDWPEAERAARAVPSQGAEREVSG
jgi:hypothetical protein